MQPVSSYFPAVLAQVILDEDARDWMGDEEEGEESAADADWFRE